MRALIGMGAALGGATRSPLTAVVFPFELTGDQRLLIEERMAQRILHLRQRLAVHGMNSGVD